MMRAKRIAVCVCAVVLAAGFAVAQTEWVDHPDNPVIGVDDPGSWAPGGLWVSSVVYDGAIYHMWFEGVIVLPSGWITGVAVGHATSPDGVEWTMDPANPVIPAGDPGEWDDEAAGGGPVVYDGTQFKMWYAGWSEGSSNVGYATSPDGSTWTKYPGNPVMDRGSPGSWDDKWIQPATVLVEGATYRMWFHGRTEDYYTGLIGYAESPDGISWTKRPDPVLEPADYPGSVEASFLYPSVAFDGTTYHMWHTNDAPASYVDVHYAYSSDGIEWTKHRYNPVHELADETIFTVSVLPDGDTWQMWYTHWGAAQNSMVSFATSDCCPSPGPPLENWQFIPAAAVASGAEGSFYQTDVDVGNRDHQMAEYQFLWLPRDEDNSEPAESEIFTLEAGNCTRYSNVLTEVFDLEPNSFGALLIKASSPDLLAMSRTYNLGIEKTVGTFGQAMPAMTTAEFIDQGETARLLFGTENADMRTNVGCQNASDSMTVVYLDLFNADGTSLGRETMILKPLGNNQVNRIFDGHNPMNGYVTVTPTQADKPIYCYGSVLDNTTSDPTTIPPQ
jgi:hypothetical protein